MVLDDQLRPAQNTSTGAIEGYTRKYVGECPRCGHMILHKELEWTERVYNHCDYYMRLLARSRLAMLFDNNGFRCIELPEVQPEPLKFCDFKRYTDRLQETQIQTGQEQPIIIVAYGTIGCMSVVMAVFKSISRRVPWVLWLGKA